LANPYQRSCVRLLAALVVALLPLASGAGEGPGKLRAIVDGAIRPLMARNGIPGMAVALTVDGQVQVFNYGVSSIRQQTPVTDATLFEIGSVSKMFTTTLAAYAQAMGKLSLDDSPGRYLPALRDRPIDRASLLHLGTYTAGGLPLQFPDGVQDDAAAISYLHEWVPDAPPGMVRSYSNPSIGLLGAATAAAMQERFATLIEGVLLPKFGMHETFLHVPDRAMADYAWGTREGKEVRVHPGAFDEQTYGIKTTARDLIRFVQANIDPAALEPALRDAILATQVPRFRVAGFVQGFGWEQYPYPLSRASLLEGNSEGIIYEPNPAQVADPASTGKSRLFDKTGSTGGFGAYVVFLPLQRIGIVMLANRSLPIPERVDAAYTILEQLAPR